MARLQFTAEGGDDDTGWFLWSIDAQAFEAPFYSLLHWDSKRGNKEILR